MDITKMFVHDIDMRTIWYTDKRTIWSWYRQEDDLVYRQEDDLVMVQTRGRFGHGTDERSSNSIVGSFYCLSSSLPHTFLHA